MKTKNKIRCTLSVLIISFLTTLIFYSCSKSSGSNNGVTNTGGNTPNSVIIKNFSFSPNALTIAKGTKVTWINNDGVTHTVTATDNGNTFSSGSISPGGGTYSFTFATSGDFNYKCSIHQQMTAIIHVQ